MKQLFEEELELLEADKMDQWQVAYERISALGLKLIDTRTHEEIGEFLLHIKMRRNDMEQRTITVMNWMSFILLTPATVILAWKMVRDKLKQKVVSPELITVGLLDLAAVMGVAQLNVDRSWPTYLLLLAQLVLATFLTIRLWSPLKQKLRGE